jgi:hypothetical protein
MATSASGRFNEDTKRELPKLTALINPQVQELPDSLPQTLLFGTCSKHPD